MVQKTVLDMEDILEVEKQRVVYYKDRLDKESQKVDKLLKLLEESNIPVPQDVKEDNYEMKIWRSYIEQ